MTTPETDGSRPSRRREAVWLSRRDHERLRVAARLLGVSRSAAVRLAVAWWLRRLAAEAAGPRLARRRAWREGRCPHPRATWQHHRDEPPYCPWPEGCAAPVCPRCRRRYELVALDADSKLRGVAVYEGRCACPRP